MSDVFEKYVCWVIFEKKMRWAFYPDGRFAPRYPIQEVGRGLVKPPFNFIGRLAGLRLISLIDWTTYH